MIKKVRVKEKTRCGLCLEDISKGETAYQYPKDSVVHKHDLMGRPMCESCREYNRPSGKTGIFQLAGF